MQRLLFDHKFLARVCFGYNEHRILVHYSRDIQRWNPIPELFLSNSASNAPGRWTRGIFVGDGLLRFFVVEVGNGLLLRWLSRVQTSVVSRVHLGKCFAILEFVCKSPSFYSIPTLWAPQFLYQLWTKRLCIYFVLRVWSTVSKKFERLREVITRPPLTPGSSCSSRFDIQAVSFLFSVKQRM